MIAVSHLTESFERAASRATTSCSRRGCASARSELRETQLEIVQRLGRAAEWRDADTGQHIERMARLSQALGAAIGMSPAEAELLGHASVAARRRQDRDPRPRSCSSPGSSRAEEREMMKTHATIGARS